MHLMRRHVCAALLAAGCRQRRRQDNVLRMVVWLEPVGLDPHRTPAAGSYRVLELMYQGLVQLDDSMTPVPCLASDVIRESDTVYRFELRRGVRFHHGREFSTEDVVYSMERIRREDTGAPLRDRFLFIDRIEPISRYSLRVCLSRPYASFLTLLARPDATILPADHGPDFERRSCGTGPFELVWYRPHDGIILKRNPNYWEAGLPRLNGIEVRFLADNLTRVAALESGQMDLISHVPGKEVRRLRRLPGIHVLERESTWFEYIGLNNRRRPLDDSRVRRALKLATDFDALVQVEWFGNARAVDGWVIPPWHPYSLQQAGVSTPSKRNVAAARALLSQAGVAHGAPLRLMLNNALKSTYLPVATVLESNWRDAGIRLELQFADVGLYYANMTQGHYDVIVTGSSSYIDAEEFLCWFETGHPWNWQNFADEDIERQLRKAKFVDGTERRDLYTTIQRRLLEEHMPVIPFSYSPVIFAARDCVRDFLPMRNFSGLGLKSAWLDSGTA